MPAPKNTGQHWTGTLADYQRLVANDEVDAYSLYFCSTTGGFCLFMGTQPLVLAPSPQHE